MLVHSRPMRDFSRLRRWSEPSWQVALLLVCFVPGSTSPLFAQPPDDAFRSWTDVEKSPRFKEVSDALKSGGALDEATRDFVTKILLTQFEKDENLPTLHDIRKKIRDRFLLPIGNDEVFTQVSMLIRDRLNEIARDTTEDTLLRVNAMLFIGEQTDKGRIPWPPARETLEAAIKDTTLDPAVRIAAVSGLNNHLSSLGRLAGQEATAVRSAAVSMLPALLPAPQVAPEGSVEQRSPAEAWLASRGLILLPVALTNATPDIATLLATVLDDGSWPFDVRVRAAMALAKTAGPESGINPRSVTASIRKAAIDSLDADRREALRLLELRGYKNGGAGDRGMAFMAPGAMPGMGDMEGGQAAQDGLSVAVCRRAAWRLYMLGDALVPDSKKGGIAGLMDKDDGEARTLAARLKEIGQTLDAEPYGYVLLQALDDLDPAGAKKRAVGGVGGSPNKPPVEGAPTPGSDTPSPKPSDSPFGDSPF